MIDMPVIRVSISDIEALLGSRVTLEKLYKGLTKLKCEVDNVEGDILEYEANHDRPDLFSAEGLARALRPFLGLEGKQYYFVNSSIKGYSEGIPGRPYIALAVVRDVVLNEEAIVQIMQLQEKLASTYGRARRKASIGVYDLDKIKPPIYYRAVDPYETRYKPLNENREMTLRQVLSETEKGRLYGYIIESMERYPVLMDSKGTILSLAPILNSDDNKVTTNTRNILIDSTGLNPEIVVDMVTIMAVNIAERSQSRVIEVVGVEHPGGLIIEAPRRKGRLISVNLSDVSRLIGVDISVEDAVRYLSLHYYTVRSIEGGVLTVETPIYRIDARSWVDVAEDIAISYGYDAIGRQADSLPYSTSIGKIHPLEYISRRVRDILVGLGFTEIANYMMTSIESQTTLMGYNQEVFVVENPKSDRYTAIRSWLTPGIIEAMIENKGKRARLAVFEIGDVVLPDESMETGARVERRIGIAVSHEKATLTDGLAVVRTLFKELGVALSFEKTIVPGLLPERTAAINVNGEQIGFVGEVKPEILYKLGLMNPVVVSEINLNKIINYL